MGCLLDHCRKFYYPIIGDASQIGGSSSNPYYKQNSLLVMDKVGMEHVVDSGSNLRKRKKGKGVAVDLGFPMSGDMAEACLMVKR